MTTGGDQTLTAVKSPLATEEQRDIAVLLMVGSAENPGLPANRRLQIVGNGLEIGRRPPEHSRPGVNTALLDDDTLVSGHHARIVPRDRESVCSERCRIPPVAPRTLREKGIGPPAERFTHASGQIDSTRGGVGPAPVGPVA